ncbi:VOC family protein [Roseiconus lacunae]|uniref:VOC family protein n=1 Tax=Roseiconus lacunae TaxID=2605694 RepID=UPI001358168C|nr:VOC family protein [Roseiconus lacunae]MCD0463340.1 VOC family protein [Roseiconus lacunae]WRQ52460.1 VOC family protein [Stieleria sp. HD01]
MEIKQRITPFLSYRDRAEEAVEFYVSVVPDSKIVRKVYNPESQAVLTIDFELCGMKFVALNAGQDWKFTEAFSLAISCETQEEIDELWGALLAGGGSELACGWLKDKFGMCWQVWPALMEDWFAADDPAALQRMFQSLWQMKKLDLQTLKQAFDGNV